MVDAGAGSRQLSGCCIRQATSYFVDDHVKESGGRLWCAAGVLKQGGPGPVTVAAGKGASSKVVFLL